MQRSVDTSRESAPKEDLNPRCLIVNDATRAAAMNIRLKQPPRRCLDITEEADNLNAGTETPVAPVRTRLDGWEGEGRWGPFCR